MVIDKSAICPFCQSPLFFSSSNGFACPSGDLHKQNGRLWGWCKYFTNEIGSISLEIKGYSLSWHIDMGYMTLWGSMGLIKRLYILFPFDPNNIDIEYWNNKIKTLITFQ